MSDGISAVPGGDGWQYEAFTHDPSDGMVRVPLVRPSDGKETAFCVPDSLNDSADIDGVARIVIGAIVRAEGREGLGS